MWYMKPDGGEFDLPIGGTVKSADAGQVVVKLVTGDEVISPSPTRTCLSAHGHARICPRARVAAHVKEAAHAFFWSCDVSPIRSSCTHTHTHTHTHTRTHLLARLLAFSRSLTLPSAFSSLLIEPAAQPDMGQVCRHGQADPYDAPIVGDWCGGHDQFG